MSNEEVKAILGKHGLFLTMAFNQNDRNRLKAAESEEQMLEEYRKIQNEISGVAAANRAINHSNHS